MDAVQRDLASYDAGQIDNGGMSIYTTLDPGVQNAAQDALEKQTHQNEHHPIFIIRSKRVTSRLKMGKGDSSMPYLEGAVVVIDNGSGAFARSSEGAITRKASSTGRWLRQPTGRFSVQAVCLYGCF